MLKVTQKKPGMQPIFPEPYHIPDGPTVYIKQ